MEQTEQSSQRALRFFFFFSSAQMKFSPKSAQDVYSQDRAHETRPGIAFTHLVSKRISETKAAETLSVAVEELDCLQPVVKLQLLVPGESEQATCQ